MKFLKIKRWYKGAAIMTVATLMASQNLFAAGPPKPSALNNPLALTLVVVAAVLLLAIALLAYVVIGAAKVYVEKLKEQKEAGTPVAKILTITTLLLLSVNVFAADEPAVAQVVTTATTIGGMTAFSFYLLISVIAAELIILMALALFLKNLIAKEKIAMAAAVQTHEAKEPWLKSLWARMNNFKPVHEEADLELDHDYDGIRELDNRLPPWWLYGFYACILFSFVYLYRYHVSHSAPSTVQEYEIAVAKADAEKEEYLKKAANKVDENTVTLLTDPAALAEGKKIFTGSCAPCHGPEGQGTVGPNLTDEYWLHKGSVKDVFKTIKYGVPEKGMKAWEDDFSPTQIASLASYIKSLKGTKPVNAKEPQGDIYKEESASAPADTTKIAAAH